MKNVGLSLFTYRQLLDNRSISETGGMSPKYLRVVRSKLYPYLQQIGTKIFQRAQPTDR